MSRDDVQRWKDKYLENIEQQERLQRRWDARIDLLRRGLVRSSLAAEGSDKAVDQCMKELREILRRDDMDAGLSGLIPRLEKAVLDSGTAPPATHPAEHRCSRRTGPAVAGPGPAAGTAQAAEAVRPRYRGARPAVARDSDPAQRAEQAATPGAGRAQGRRRRRRSPEPVATPVRRQGVGNRRGAERIGAVRCGGKQYTDPTGGGHAVPAGRRARRGARRPAAAVARQQGRRHRKRASGLGRGRRAWRAEPDPAG